MTREECIALLGDGWQGYELVGVRREPSPEGGEQVLLQLCPAESSGACSGCGQFVDEVHDYSWRYVRDLPILDAKTILVVHRRRMSCPACGPKLEALGWLHPYARVTRRLAESVARLCSVMTIKHVAEHFDLNWHQVKEIDKRILMDQLGPVDLSSVTQIALDEFAIHKGQRYATVIAEPATRRILYVAQGRERLSIRPFFEALGDDGCARIEAAVMDMWRPFRDEVTKWCPNAAIVFDLFHVLQNYSKDVIDRTRIDIANQLANDKPARKVVKGSKWLLLRNRSNLDEQQRVSLDELLTANQDLMTVYVLGEDIRELWQLRNQAKALRFFRGWLARARASGITQLARFADMLEKHRTGILAHCRYPLSTGFLEGMNNKIKVMKRMAYGYRDLDYFFLKLRGAFPGNPR
jgi:transposase